MARLHVIFFDSTLAPACTFLKVGVLQIILSMCEAGYMSPRLCLLDPLDAVVRWSHDPDLRARARLVGGVMVTAVELQLLFLEEAKAFVERGFCDGYVPDAGRIINLWEDTLLKLRHCDLDGLAPRLDWVMRRMMIERAMTRNGLSLRSPEASHLDILFSSLDSEEGLYWSVERAGLVEPIVTEEEIARFAANPPEDTRAWTRAMLLRRAGPGRIDSIDWDRISMTIETEDGHPAYRTVWLDNPLALTRAGTEQLFAESPDMLTLTSALGATETEILTFMDGAETPTHEGPMH